MRYEILGPLRVKTDDGTTAIAARKSEMILTTLLARYDQVVSVGQLVDEIWGEDIPRRATAGLHVHISQLRKLLKRGGRAAAPILTQSPGYLLELGNDEFDLLDFQRLSQEGREHHRAGDHHQAVEQLQAALALWRGKVPDFADPGPIIGGFLSWLSECRMESIDAFVSSTMNLNGHAEMIGFLYAMIAEYPLHESFYQQLMVALYRSDRRADALRVYNEARATLRGELGLDPNPALRMLQARILNGDTEATDPTAAPSLHARRVRTHTFSRHGMTVRRVV
ncbi:BTAD domain-containing putative transcriptional regulator [Streptomyces sp. NPDC102467]|uniref:AfsR/SARP family transcriptional regulator n=1 Tax=Streptomyces sp. NPDC102467 TaxID=3366179 RepID=UPI003806F987